MKSRSEKPAQESESFGEGFPRTSLIPRGSAKQAPNPLSPRRERFAHCSSSFNDDSYVQECRECQASVHANCLRPHWEQKHAERRFDSDDEDPDLRKHGAPDGEILM